MSHQLDSARSCVDYAKSRIRELEREIARFEATTPYEEIEIDDPQPGWRVRKVKFKGEVPRVFSHIAFDVVNQLRAALDQAGFAVAIANGTKGREAHFPFGDKAVEVASRKAGKSKDIPANIFALMESFGPHKDGDVALWGLNKFCNANKHEVTIAPVIKPDNVKIGSGLVKGPAQVCNRWDGGVNELTLARYGSGGGVSNRFTYSFSVQVGVPAHTLGQPVVQYLDAVADTVAKILGAIDNEARTVGLV